MAIASLPAVAKIQNVWCEQLRPLVFACGRFLLVRFEDPEHAEVVGASVPAVAEMQAFLHEQLGDREWPVRACGVGDCCFKHVC